MLKPKQPEIRFKGFSEVWINKNLEEEVEFFSGLTYSPFDITDRNGTLVLRSSNVQNGEVSTISNVYVRSEVVNCKNVEVGDIIVVVRNGSRNLIGKHATVKYEMKNTVIGAFMTGIKAKNYNFINALFDSESFSSEVNKNLGATINQITNGTFKSMNFAFPNSEEQTQIGTFFRQLDIAIALHERKHTQTLNLKKAMLEKMFPKADCHLPQIRFKGFSGDWEKVKLSELGQALSGTAIEAEFEKSGKYKVISIGSYSLNSVYIDQGLRVNKTEKTKDRILRKNDLTMVLNDKTISGALIGRVLLIDKDDTYIFNQRTQRIIINQDLFDPQFLYQILNADFFRKKIIVSAQGNTQIYVNWSTIRMIEYSMPEKAEQKTIGNFFRQLDDIFTLQTQQLEKLKNIKQAFLAKMYV